MTEAIKEVLPSCKSSDEIKHISQNKFSYINNHNITTIYLVFNSYASYKKHIANIPHKLIKSYSFYIAELL